MTRTVDGVHVRRAAEIAADALKATGRARIVGEKTPGAVLSSKLFDIPGGFERNLPSMVKWFEENK